MILVASTILPSSSAVLEVVKPSEVIGLELVLKIVSHILIYRRKTEVFVFGVRQFCDAYRIPPVPNTEYPLPYNNISTST